VLARDPAADDTFVFAVSTTGVYCRPSCGARAPRPENVSFHATCADAERAGFRACKRCNPSLPPLAERNAALVAELCRELDRDDTTPRLDTLARARGLSVSHLSRTFKAVTGLTPKAYADARRATRVQEALGRAGSVTEAIYEAGYGGSSRFYEASKRVLGMTASAFRKGGRGERIGYSVVPCRLGQLLVATTEKGACCILLGDEPKSLVRDLEIRFPAANLVSDVDALTAMVDEVVRLVERPHELPALELPLDLRGTAFQRRVWQALRELPVGRTVTYEELARSIDAPKSARAVASACARNPLAVAVPCHRVIGKSGSLSGYRWGLERKRELLRLEREGGEQPARSEPKREARSR
jgi:AraC family transcriptional regulator of adaptative response/methylated-DNA-[protein]-cysteine methyltransferase